MPALAGRSLWEAVAPSLKPSLSGLLITGGLSNPFGKQGQPVTLNLFVQNPASVQGASSVNNPTINNPVDLVSIPILSMRAPDNSLMALTSTTVPAISHVALSGIYSITINPYLPGNWRYEWYLGSEPIFGGEFYCTPVSP